MLILSIRSNCFAQDLFVLGVACVAGSVAANETVAANDDLNELTARGCYRCRAASITRTVTNRPSDSSDSYGFSLINIKPYGDTTAYETQIFIQLDGMWLRYATGTSAPFTWTEWKKIAFVQ